MPFLSYRLDTILFIFEKRQILKERRFSDLKDQRLLKRGNIIFDKLFKNSVHSVRQITQSDSEAKSVYRFLQNDNVSEGDVIKKHVL